MKNRLTLDCPALAEISVLEATVTERLSTPTAARVTVLAQAPLDVTAAVGELATLSLEVDRRLSRSFTLVVMAVTAERTDADDLTYAIELEHATALLGLRHDTRLFLDKSAKDIVQEVLVGAGHPAPEWSLKRAPVSRETCLQYRETDLAFVSRLLADEGIWWSVHDDRAPIELCDDLAALPPIAGKSDVPFSAEGAGTGVQTLELDHAVTSDAITLTDWDFKKPGLDLRSTSLVSDEKKTERFEYPGGYLTQAEGAALAKVRAEELASGRLTGRGTSDRTAFRAGSWFKLTATFETAIARKYLLRSVVHDVTADAYENTFTCSPMDLPYRPARLPRPLVDGAHTATVAGPAGEEIHTDAHGRMKAKLAFDRAPTQHDKASSWLRVAQPELGGGMALARVGWEMATRYLDGEPDRPIVVARLYDGTHPPPETLPRQQATSSYQTLSSPRAEKLNALTMNDKGGGMKVSLLAGKDLDGTVLNDRATTIGQHDSWAIDQDTTTLLGGNQSLTVDKDDTTTIAKDAGVAVAGDRTKTVSSDEAATVLGGLSTKVNGKETEKVGMNRTAKAKKQITETTKGAYATTVGGALKSHAGKDYEIYVAGKASEVVGGAKSVTSSSGALSELVAEKFSLTVGGACIHTVTGHRMASTVGASTLKIGALASLTGASSFQVKGSKIKITVAGVANLAGGGGVLTLTPASASFVGVLTFKGSGGVEIAGSPQLVG